MPFITDVSNVAQLAVIIVAAVWSIAKVNTTANVLKALVERMEQQMLRLQSAHTRLDRRVAKLEGMARKAWDQDSPPGGDEE